MCSISCDVEDFAREGAAPLSNAISAKGIVSLNPAIRISDLYAPLQAERTAYPQFLACTLARFVKRRLQFSKLLPVMIQSPLALFATRTDGHHATLDSSHAARGAAIYREP